MSYMKEKMIERMNEERQKMFKKEIEEEYEFECWLDSLEYFELTRGR